MTEQGHNSANDVAGRQLLAFIQRIENIEAEIKDRNEDKREIYSEIKGSGFDPQIVKRVVSIRRMDDDKRREEETILALYLQSIGDAI